MDNNQLNGLTIEMIMEFAVTCKTREEFRKKYKRIYNEMVLLGWKDKLKEIIPNKPHKEHKPHSRKWTYETLKNEASKYETRGEFMKANVSAYNCALKNDRYEEIVSHMGEKKKFQPKMKWTLELVSEIYNGCKSLKQLREVHGQKIVSCAMRNGWHDKLSAHFVKEPRINIKWTFEKVKEEAEKYNSRKEFGVNSPSAYQKALEKKWMDALSTHMKGGYTKWTKEKMMEMISDCNDMKDLKRKSSALHVYIIRNNLQKTLFK